MNMRFYSDEKSKNMTFCIVYYKEKQEEKERRGGFVGIPLLTQPAPPSKTPPEWQENSPCLQGKTIPNLGSIKILDPFSIPLEDLKTICEDYSIPILWVIGKNAYKETSEDLSNFSVNYAIERYLKNLRYSRTVKAYRSVFRTLINCHIIDPNRLVKYFITEKVTFSNFKNKIKKEKAAQRCYRIYKNFIQFLQTRQKNPNTIQRPQWASQRNTIPLNRKELKSFLFILEKIDKRAYLVALLLIWYNKAFKKSFQQGHHVYVSLTEILRLKTADLSVRNRIPNLRKYKGKIAASNIALSLPKRLFNPLKNLAESSYILVFENRKGGPLHPDEIARYFRKAGREAGISRTVSPILLRPIYKKR